MKKEMLIPLVLLALAAGFLLGFLLGVSMDLIPDGSQVPETQITQPTAPEVQVTEPAVPETDATEPPQAPTQIPETTIPVQTQPEETIRTLYTDEQLLSLDNTHITYGPGLAKNGDPAPYAPDAQKRYGQYDGHFLEDAENVIYLTFDCGYEYFLDGQPLTGMILDVLLEKDVKAVFFVTGSYVRSNPQLVQRIIDEGHILGNHSEDHKHMPSLSIREMEEQILTLHETVRSQFGYTMKFFRPPEGAFSHRSLAVTQNLGYETVHWSFAYADWNTDDQPDPQAALEKILSCHHDGAIYLLHAVSATNARILGDVIDGLQAMGYRLELLP